jgi:DNA-binding NtrC family response regulator
MTSVLVVDDKEMMRDSVGGTLRRAGFSVVTAPDGAAALEMVAQKRPDALVTDLRMPGMSGLELLERLRKVDEELPVLVMTAFGTIETAVRALKLGAFDYLTKPFEGDELVIAVKRAVEHGRLRRENALLRAGGDGATTCDTPRPARRGVDRLIGSSAVLRQLREQARTIAQSGGGVLITGESGAGKEVVARAIHEESPRSRGPFLAVNCAALSESLLESELFGHERGAFTGADRMRKGRFELADGGTLLLDEISEIAPGLQAKLLRVLQERAFERVGSSVTIGVDVRVLATSNRDLPGEVRRGAFRQDLFFRVNVLPIVVPPLRERLEDVPELARHFVEEVCAREGRATPEIEASALALLSSYSWPGNVRELQNVCERAVVLCGLGQPAEEPRRITATLVAPWLTGSAPSPPSSNGVMIEPKPTFVAGEVRPLEDVEREIIVEALRRFNGHRQKTARALGIGVRTLGLKLKRWKELRLVEEEL